MSSITNLISVGVNGTGTANSVMKWLDADTATDSIIYDNGTNIGIGTSSPSAPFSVIGSEGSAVATFTTLNSGSSNRGIRIVPRTYGASIEAVGLSTELAFNTSDATGTAERMRILAGGGLTFNGDTAAANALDDYEEGTFTPVVADAATGGNTASVGVATGAYTKVGRLVNVSVVIGNINTSGLTSTNTLFVRNLPFTITETSYSPVQLDDITFSGNYVIVQANTGGNAAYMKNITSGLSDTDIRVSAVDSTSSDILFSLTYMA